MPEAFGFRKNHWTWWRNVLWKLLYEKFWAKRIWIWWNWSCTCPNVRWHRPICRRKSAVSLSFWYHTCFKLISTTYNTDFMVHVLSSVADTWCDSFMLKLWKLKSKNDWKRFHKRIKSFDFTKMKLRAFQLIISSK